MRGGRSTPASRERETPCRLYFTRLPLAFHSAQTGYIEPVRQYASSLPLQESSIPGRRELLTQALLQRKDAGILPSRSATQNAGRGVAAPPHPRLRGLFHANQALKTSAGAVTNASSTGLFQAAGSSGPKICAASRSPFARADSRGRFFITTMLG